MKVPLARLLRPKTLDDIVGQDHLIGQGKPLRKLIENELIPSIILYGRPGTGKTTIAEVISNITKTKFIKLNATNATIKDIRQIGESSKTENSLVFVDEIHRFSKTQQDALLPYVEEGNIIFIGATTENPFHSINAPLISRCQIFELEPLTSKDICKLIIKTYKYIKQYNPQIKIDEDAIKRVINISNKDGRKAISIIETAFIIDDHVTVDIINKISPNRYYALSDDLHYDYASAFQGSIQASDVNAAIYWLGKWLESGEDPRYIARRLLVCAAEDAYSNPICTSVAHAAYLSACEIGRPECDILLSQAVCLIATSKRDKTAAYAIWGAVADIRKGVDIEVPKPLRDCHYQGSKELNNGSYKDGKAQNNYIGINKIYFKPEIYGDMYAAGKRTSEEEDN